MILYPVRGATKDKKFISQNYYSGTGLYPTIQGTKSHAALDIQTFHGDALLAAEDLIPYKVFDLDNETLQQGLTRGFGVQAVTVIPPGGVGREYIYWHCMSNIQCEVGKLIKQGDILAFEGDSGVVYHDGIPVPDYLKGKPPYPGFHLHWGYREVKRIRANSGYLLTTDQGFVYFDKEGYSYEIQDYDNGNKGFKDPLLLDLVYYNDWVIKTAADALKMAQDKVLEVETINDPSTKYTALEAIKSFLYSLLSWVKGKE